VSSREPYGRLDRLLYRISLRSGRAQRTIADIETLLFSRELAALESRSPVFITGLPRCGTTALLRALHATGRFATHTYRDAPFVMAPLLWRRFSRRFTVDTVTRERLHGDGLTVSADSPEAFEEVIWKQFWPGHYMDDRIVPWTASERHPEFEEFLEEHIRKILLLHGRHEPTASRYLSKNNLNISRLALPLDAFRRGRILVPFREPVQHAASLRLQHVRFSEIHARDDFVRVFMEGIGHFEFGRCLRPVNFDGWLAGAPAPDTLSFWLRYWVAAYRFVLRHAGPSVCFVPYDHLSSTPEPVLRGLATVLHLPATELLETASGLHGPRWHEVDEAGLHPRVLEEARTIHSDLLGRSI
jgi:hypothetical protein